MLAYQSWEGLTARISEVQIAEKCLDLTKIPCTIKSPFREDKRPSVGIYEKEGKVYFKDFATGDFWDLQTLLCSLYNLDINDLCEHILNNHYLIPDIKVGYSYSTSENKNPTIIKSTEREWMSYDIEYWNSYGISRDWLEIANVHPISYFFINNQIYVADKFAYVYLEWKDGVETQKIYQPYNHRGAKWFSSYNSSIWSLWTKLPGKGDKLIITSSLKDALCLWENTGIPACSLQSESTYPKPKVVQQLKDRFKDIFVFFDNDFSSIENHGRLFSKKLCGLYDFYGVEIPTKYTAKDPSDFMLYYGKRRFKELIYDLLEKCKAWGITQNGVST